MSQVSPQRHKTGPITGLGRTVLSLAIAVATVVLPALASPPAAAAVTAPTGGFYPTDGVTGLDPERGTTINASIRAMDAQDGVLFVGGAFTETVDRSGWRRFDHRYLAAFDEGTGEILTWFRAQPDGPVYEVVALGNDRILIAGEFTTVNGQPDTAGVAILDAKTGAVDSSFKLSLDPVSGERGRVNAVDIHGSWLYLGGNFVGLTGGSTNTHISTSRLARVSLATGQPDPAWAPVASGGGVWGIGVSNDGQRVHIGGRFTSLNFDGNAALFATVDTTTGSLISGWPHGLPHAQPWPGYVYDVEVAPQGQVVVAGKPHFYAILDSSTGTKLRDVTLPSDGQSIDIDGNSILIGCHCSGDQSWFRQINATTLNQTWSTSNLQGRAGVFAAHTRQDGCAFGGGELTRGTTISNSTTAAFNMALYCPGGTSGTATPLSTAPEQTDTVPPTAPGTPTIVETTASSVRLSWSAGSDDRGDVTYRVIRNGVVVGSTGGTSFYDSDLPQSQTYDWQIMAVDLAGNSSPVSPRSTRLSVGTRTNTAIGKNVQQSSTRDFYTADRAVDGNTSGSFGVGSIAVMQAGDRTIAGAWWNIDLGAVTGVEEIKIHPHTDVGGGTAHLNWQMRAYYSNTPIIEPTFFQAALGGYTHLKGAKAPAAGTTRIETFQVNDDMRYLRIYAGESTELEIAEVEIFTVPTSVVGTARPSDTVEPQAPTWRNTTTKNGQTVVRFGGASDNVGVVRYDVYDGNTLLGSTTTNDLWLPTPGVLASTLTIVSHDASGNASANEPTGPVVPPAPGTPQCEFTRGNGNVVVTWSNLGSADRVVVERSVDGSPFWWRGRVEDGAVLTLTDSDRVGASMSYQVKTLTGFTYSAAVPCTEDTTPPIEAPSCNVHRDGSVVTVTWSDVVWPEVTIHRAVDGGSMWWRGRQTTSGSDTFADTDRPGVLSYEIQPLFGQAGTPVSCS